MAPVIGVFDSGFGGLTVLRELRKVLPGADYLYFGDTAHLPYGAKSVRTVAKYAVASAQFLEAQGIQFLVIACNTATALALDEIRASIKIPVVGVIEPGAECVAQVSRCGRAAVIATEATVSSHAYRRALEKVGVSATELACPLFVPLVEEGWVEHPVTEQVAHIYIDQVFRNGSGADVLLLGCTHYPLIRPLLRRVVPENVHIVDSAESTAAKVAQMIGAGSGPGEPGTLRCYATDSIEKFRRLGEKFLGCPIQNIELIDIEK
ncbi:MAG TPA: glutamate racemase [Candidatus Angelobacter sp.]|nr:glutamate racemase [Candidatus Angelobacter sp.]